KAACASGLGGCGRRRRHLVGPIGARGCGGELAPDGPSGRGRPGRDPDLARGWRLGIRDVREPMVWREPALPKGLAIAIPARSVRGPAALRWRGWVLRNSIGREWRLDRRVSGVPRRDRPGPQRIRTNPTIEEVEVDGQIACMIWPSDDQGRGWGSNIAHVALLLVGYPPRAVNGRSIPSRGTLFLSADTDHMMEIASSLRFTGSGFQEPAPGSQR